MANIVLPIDNDIYVAFIENKCCQVFTKTFNLPKTLIRFMHYLEFFAKFLARHFLRFHGTKKILPM